MPAAAATDDLCDVNVLVALVHEGHEHCSMVRSWIDTVERSSSVLVCRVAQLGFLRLLTSPRVFVEQALSPDEAWRAYATMMSDDRFAFVDEPPNLESSLRELSTDLQPGASIGTDVFLAAFALAAGLRVTTLDTGFQRFGIEVNHL